MDYFWVGAVVVVLLVLAVWVGALVKSGKGISQPLALPEGSVRSMMGLLIIGAFVDFLLFGSQSLGDQDVFKMVLASFSTLAGAVTGFYFGSRPRNPSTTSGQGGEAKKT